MSASAESMRTRSTVAWPGSSASRWSSWWRVLPGRDDELRLAAEGLAAKKREEHRKFSAAVISTLLLAVAERDTEHSTTLPTGSRLGIAITTPVGDPGDDLPADLFVQVSIDWRDGAAAQDVIRVQDAIPGIPSNEWEAISGIHAKDGEPKFYVMVDEAWVRSLLVAAERVGVHELGDDPSLVLEALDGNAHYAHQEEVGRAYVGGHVLRSLCGRRFVPKHDPQDRPICLACANAKAAHDLVRAILHENR